MEPFQTILFAADFSDASREAFRTACSLAVEGKTRLHVLHVVEPHAVPEEPSFLGQMGVQFYDANCDGNRDEELGRRLRASYAPNVPIDVAYHVREGDDAAESSHGRRGRCRPDRGRDAWPHGIELAPDRQRGDFRHASGSLPGAGAARVE